MSALNGFGTLYYGWRHSEDSTATATKWLCACWLPLIPLYRNRLRSLTDFGSERVASVGPFAIARSNDTSQSAGYEHGPLITQIDQFEIMERLPISWKEIGMTLVITYIGLPMTFIGPAILFTLLFLTLSVLGLDFKPETPLFSVYIGSFGLCFVHFLYHCVRAIRRTRGWQAPARRKVR